MNMARAIRSVTIERGKDPREMAMVAFGGNGPLHGVDVARLLGVRKVIAPLLSGVFAAAGMLSADVEHNFVHASPRRLADVTVEWLAEQTADLKRRGSDALRAEGYDEASSTFLFFLDLRYFGQSSELTIPLKPTESDESGLAAMAERFRQEHGLTYGYETGEPVELANLRLNAIGRSERRLRFSDIVTEDEGAVPLAAKRRVSLDPTAGFTEVPIVQRKRVGPSAMAGPAIIESYDTTILVPSGCSYRADPIGNIIIDIDN